MTGPAEPPNAPEGEDPERARVRQRLLGRGVLQEHLAERVIDFWMAKEARDRQEGESLGYRRPNPMFFGGGG